MGETARRVKHSRFAIICASVGTGLAGIPAAIAEMPLLTFAGSIVGGIAGSILDRRYPPYESADAAESPRDSQ